MLKRRAVCWSSAALRHSTRLDSTRCLTRPSALCHPLGSLPLRCSVQLLPTARRLSAILLVPTRSVCTLRPAILSSTRTMSLDAFFKPVEGGRPKRNAAIKPAAAEPPAPKETAASRKRKSVEPPAAAAAASAGDDSAAAAAASSSTDSGSAAAADSDASAPDSKRSKAESLQSLIPADWVRVLSPEFSKPYWGEIEKFLRAQSAANVSVFPKREHIFRALDLCPFDQVRVVILGQDPYQSVHTERIAQQGRISSAAETADS